MSITFPRAARALLLTCAFALVATSSADAAVLSGAYKGKTEQQAKISLKVTSSRKAVVNFAWEGVVMPCSDGQNRPISGLKSPSSVKFSLTRSGKFGFNATPEDGFEFAVAGQIKGKKAAGVIQVQVKINDQNTVDPNGTITCDSDLVGWTAKHK